MMVAIHPPRRPAGLRRLLIHFGLWRQLLQAKRLLVRSAAAREAGEIVRAARYLATAGEILVATRRAFEAQESGS